ncbi:hypothetical protein QBC41DRAFT_354275 [Cercophora samala]|uniref:Zn(2)-C6 fungal-type domain-containing protein n=1 Tax=Cercophora samala TaxID=330535 RepID=A0AA39ZI83_9PEZI|nr:hypothetical protein QBC41DRAFT_354275 [Cercophora samala]
MEAQTTRKEPGSLPGSGVHGSIMSTLPSQGQPPITVPTLPPMPRRQSCDRCHELKVRCVTDGHDNTALGLGVIGEESEASRGRSVIAPVPCARCSKAGTVCIFSPQLRSGRPRVHRHPVRKRARRSSICPSSPAEVSPTDSQSLSPRPATFSFPVSKPRLDFRRQSQVQPTPLLLSTTLSPSLDGMYASQRGHDIDTPATILSNFTLPASQGHFPGNHDHFHVFSHAEASGVEFVPPFSESILSATSTTTDHAWVYSGSSDTFLEEVTQINLRIHRAGRMLSTITRALLTIASPAINEIFDVGCSLISFLDRYAARQMTSPQTPLENRRSGSDGYRISHGSTSTSAPMSSAIETATSLTALSSHQLLLGMFEDISTSFLAQINSGQAATPPSTPSRGAFFGPSHGQMLAIVNLISHLMEQLDRAFQSLGVRQQDTSEGSEVLTAAASSVAVASTHDSEFDHALGFGRHPPLQAGQPSQGPVAFEGQKEEKRTARSLQEGVVSVIFSQVEQRQMWTREQVTMLRRLLGGTG